MWETEKMEINKESGASFFRQGKSAIFLLVMDLEGTWLNEKWFLSLWLADNGSRSEKKEDKAKAWSVVAFDKV